MDGSEPAQQYEALISHGNCSCTALQGGERALVAEVIEFDEFVEAHGACGGWHPDDHAEFLRILTSCRGDYSHAILIATDQLPGVSKDEIVSHARQVTHPSMLPSSLQSNAEWAVVACRSHCKVGR